MVNRLLPADYARIREVVAAAEARTKARFVVTVVPASDRYALYPLVFGAMIAFALGAILALFWPEMDLRRGFALMAATFIVVSLIFDWYPLRLLLVPDGAKRSHAHNLAHRAFAAQILASQHRESGMVFFVSLAEHHVEIMADRALHEHVGQEAWDGIVADFVAAAKAGKLGDGIVNAISRSADLLAAHAPA